MYNPCKLWKKLVLNLSDQRTHAAINAFGAPKMVAHCLQCLACDALNKQAARNGKTRNVKLAIRFLVRASEAEEQRSDEYLGASVDVIIPETYACWLAKRFEQHPQDPAVLRAVKRYGAGRLLEHGRDCRHCIMRFLQQASEGKPCRHFIILFQLADSEDARKLR